MPELPHVRRVGLIGDAHCQDVILESVLAHFEKSGVDSVFCVGDILDGPGDANRTCRLLRDRGVITVAGNHERWFLASEMRNLPHVTLAVADDVRDFLSALPRTLRFQTPHGELLLCHGIGDDDMVELRPATKGFGLQAIRSLRTLMSDTSLRFLVGGHTHERMVRALPNLTVINAGTILPGAYETGVYVCDFDQLCADFYPLAGALIGKKQSSAITLRN